MIDFLLGISEEIQETFDDLGVFENIPSQQIVEVSTVLLLHHILFSLIGFCQLEFELKAFLVVLVFLDLLMSQNFLLFLVHQP